MSKKAKNKENEIPVDNNELYNEILISKQNNKLTENAIRMFILIAEGISNKFIYLRQADKQDCIQSANLDLLKYWNNFDLKYKNAFAYYTEIAKKGAAKGWNKLYPKKYHGTISLDSTGFNEDNSDGIYSV